MPHHPYVNLLAVVVAALAAWILGALWYSPLLFAKAWVKAHALTDEQLEGMKKKAGPAYILSFIGFLVMAFVFSHIVHLTHGGGLHWGALLGFGLWLGFAAPIGLMNMLYTNKRPATFVIDAGYQLVYLIVMGMILAAW